MDADKFKKKKSKAKQQQKNRHELISQELTLSHLVWKEVEESGTFLRPLMFSKCFHAHLSMESHRILPGGLDLDKHY